MSSQTLLSLFLSIIILPEITTLDNLIKQEPTILLVWLAEQFIIIKTEDIAHYPHQSRSETLHPKTSYNLHHLFPILLAVQQYEVIVHKLSHTYAFGEEMQTDMC